MLTNVRGLKPTAMMISRYATHATMPPNFNLNFQLKLPSSAAADDRLKRILWNLHPLTILERGLVSNDAGERDVECVAYVDNRFFIQQDRLNKIVGQLTVRATVATATHTRGQSRASATNVRVVRFLAIDPAFFTVGVFHVLHPSH